MKEWWPTFKFPGINLLNAPPSPEMYLLLRELKEREMSNWSFPEFDHTTNTWYVRLVDAETDKTIESHDFYDEDKALEFYIERDIEMQRIRGLL